MNVRNMDILTKVTQGNWKDRLKYFQVFWAVIVNFLITGEARIFEMEDRGTSELSPTLVVGD